MVSLYYSSLEHIEKICGQAYNIGGSMQQSLSLLELFSLLEKKLNIKMKYEKLQSRVSDQKVFVADISKIKLKIAWQPKVSAQEGILEMVSWVNSIK